jgi:hypothetical protein
MKFENFSVKHGYLVDQIENRHTNMSSHYAPILFRDYKIHKNGEPII